MCSELRVLVVDDDLIDAERARRLLASDDAVGEVIVASNGWEALQYLRLAATAGALPDMVVADEVMPRMGGWELLEAIRNDPALAALPVYMLTTWSVEGAVSKSYQLGALGHITKSCDEQELAAAVASMLLDHCQPAA